LKIGSRLARTVYERLGGVLEMDWMDWMDWIDEMDAMDLGEPDEQTTPRALRRAFFPGGVQKVHFVHYLSSGPYGPSRRLHAPENFRRSWHLDNPIDFR